MVLPVQRTSESSKEQLLKKVVALPKIPPKISSASKHEVVTENHELGKFRSAGKAMNRMWLANKGRRLCLSDDISKNVATLKYGSADQQVAAAKALGEGKDHRAVPHLLRYLNAPSEKVRIAVINALAEIDGKSWRQVARKLHDKSINVRIAAAKALKKYDTSKAIPALFRAFRRAKDIGLQDEIVSALDALGMEECTIKYYSYLKSAVPSLIKYVKNPNASNKEDAVRLLTASEDSRAIPVLIPYADTRFGTYHIGVIVTLARFYKRAMPYLMKALGSNDKKTRHGAEVVLLKIDRRSIGSLIREWKRFNKNAKFAALRLMLRSGGVLGPGEPVLFSVLENHLLDVIGKERSAAVRAGVIKILAAYCGSSDKAIKKALKKALVDSDPKVRLAAAKSRALQDDKAMLGEYIKLSQDSSLKIRKVAVEVLGASTDRRADDVLTKMLGRKNEDSPLLVSVISWLQKKKVKSAIPALVKIVKNGHPDVQVASMAVLSEWKAWSSWSVMATLVVKKDVDPEVKKAAIAGLVRLNAYDSWPKLAWAMEHDPDVGVREAAVSALGKLNVWKARKRVAKMLAYSDARVRDAAVVALGEMNAYDQWREIAKRVSIDKVDYVRLTAIDTLVKLNVWHSGPILAKAMFCDSARVGMAATEALGTLKYSKGVKELIAALETNVRSEAAQALRKIGSPAVPFLTKLLPIGYCGSNRSSGCYSGNGAWRTTWKRVNVIMILGDIGDMKALPVLFHNLVYTYNSTGESRTPYLWAAIKQFGIKATPLIIKMAKKYNSDRAYQAAANVLGIIGDKRAVPFLIGLTAKEWTYAHYVVVRALGDIGDGRGLDTVKKFLTHSDKDMREAARKAVAKIRAKNSK